MNMRARGRGNGDAKPSIIVHGPAGCGKTRNSDRLRRHFGLKRVIEDGGVGYLPRHGALILTNDPDQPRMRGILAIPFATAMQQATANWATTVKANRETQSK